MTPFKNDFAADLITIFATLALAVGLTMYYWEHSTPLWIIIPVLYALPLYKSIMMILIFISKEETLK